MTTLRLPQSISTVEARAGLSETLRRFRENSDNATPVVFGSHRRPEAVVVPFAQFEALMSIAEDLEIAQMATARLATGGARPFDELLDELGMPELKA